MVVFSESHVGAYQCRVKKEKAYSLVQRKALEAWRKMHHL